MFYTLLFVIPVTVKDFLKCMWRPSIATMAMWLAVSFAGATHSLNSAALRFCRHPVHLPLHKFARTITLIVSQSNIC